MITTSVIPTAGHLALVFVGHGRSVPEAKGGPSLDSARWLRSANALWVAPTPSGEGECPTRSGSEITTMSATVLWIIAAILVIIGIVQLFAGNILWGIILIVIGCLVGPGGYSIFRSRT